MTPKHNPNNPLCEKDKVNATKSGGFLSPCTCKCSECQHEEGHSQSCSKYVDDPLYLGEEGCPAPDERDDRTVFQCQAGGCDGCTVCKDAFPADTEYELKLCTTCTQMTNHKDGVCQKHADTEGWEEEFDKKYAGLALFKTEEQISVNERHEDPRREIKSLIRSLITSAEEKRDQFWKAQEMGKSSDCAKHEAEAVSQREDEIWNELKELYKGFDHPVVPLSDLQIIIKKRMI